MGKKVFRVLIWIGVLYAFTMVGAYFVQGILIYPGQAKAGNREFGTPSSFDNFDYVTLSGTEGHTIYGFYGGQSPSTRTPAIIWFHGNGETISQIQQVVRPLRDMGFRVFAAEYRGYGQSGGTPGEKAFLEDAAAIYDWLAARPEVDREHIWAAGWSLGAAVAIELASDRSVDGVLAFSPWTSLADVGRRSYPWLPVKMLLKDKYDNRANVLAMQGPIFVAHGGADDIVPVAMGREIAELAANRGQLYVVEGAKHNDLFVKGGGPMWEEATSFVSRAGPRK